MELCEYKEVPNDCEIVESDFKKTGSWKPFFRQFLVCSGVWTAMFLYGLAVGAPTVFIPQIRREANDTSVITDEMASWLTSVYAFSGFPFVLILSMLTRFFGRKIPFIIAVTDTFAAFVVLYCSTNITHIMISEIMQGLFSASQIVVSIVILTEYTSPKYRGIFLTIKTATFYWGIWASNAIGTFLHWKMIPLFGIVCASYTFLTVILWPESPYWLASNGKFKECAASHRWLKGFDEESEKELEILIKSQKEYIASYEGIKISLKERIIDFFRTVKSRAFYKPTLISLATGFLGVFSGKLICALYALDILKKITSSESTAYTGMLILDGITVSSMYIGCALSKYLKRRTLLLVASSIGVVFLFVLSLYLYLISLGIIIENKYVSLLLLTAFSIAVSCGPLIMSISVYAELIPLRSRNLSVCCIGLVGKLIGGITLKIAPTLFRKFGLHGLFLIFGISSLILILILYKYLPETKDKTLQEIADSMNGKKENRTEHLLEHNKNNL
ncbi:facilitated trehalose transporter Tret1-like [Anticarsia gemmatalis]|uniref:facilitated trehalose transporter Tret1-like n=1 Tax=Anticarsia gemmatalis TaxID=129554 RepID=UPI003F77758B